MNSEAEAIVAEFSARDALTANKCCYRTDGYEEDMQAHIASSIREAMRWAYADAAKVCREHAAEFRISSRDAHIAGHCAHRIEARLK